jgi:hypothetical protein
VADSEQLVRDAGHPVDIRLEPVDPTEAHQQPTVLSGPSDARFAQRIQKKSFGVVDLAQTLVRHAVDDVGEPSLAGAVDQ